MKSFITDTMVITAAAEVKPDSTGAEMKRTTNPRFSHPITNSSAPHMKVSAMIWPMYSSGVAGAGDRPFTAVAISSAGRDMGPMAAWREVPNSAYTTDGKPV
jgi:hypothetical protein